jgi:hypothetical protein
MLAESALSHADFKRAALAAEYAGYTTHPALFRPLRILRCYFSNPEPIQSERIRESWKLLV